MFFKGSEHDQTASFAWLFWNFCFSRVILFPLIFNFLSKFESQQKQWMQASMWWKSDILVLKDKKIHSLAICQIINLYNV